MGHGADGKGAPADIPPRYSRQLLFDGLGGEGQARLMASRAVLVGCGALGTIQASFLVRAGVGTLRIIDRDFVEESNLQRQILYDEEDVRAALPKAAAAERKLRAINSLVTVEGLVEDLTPDNAGRLLGGFDLILDATDNFDTRLLINDYAVKTATPWIYGGCVSSYGQTFTVLPGQTACFQCLFGTPVGGLAPSCDTAGVIGPAVGVVASLQAAEALKILSGRRERVSRRLTFVDVWGNLLDSFELPPRDPECPCCGRRDFHWLEGRRGTDALTLCGRDSVQVSRREGPPLDLEALARRLAPLGTVERNRFLLRASIGAHRLTVFADGRAIIGGTSDPALARSLYTRYVNG